MKKIVITAVVVLIILTACNAANPPVPPVEPSVEATLFQTAAALSTETAQVPLPTSTPVPSATPAPSATPDTDIWRNCRQQNPEINPRVYQILGFGTSACKFQQPSPDGVYLAYAALDLPGREMLLLETMGKAREIDWVTIGRAGGCGKCTIRDVQWGPGNTLILDIAATTSGPPYVYVINLNGDVIATVRGDFGQWNEDKTAFYSALENQMFLDAFGVYDFTTGKSYNLDKHNGVKVAGWTENGLFLSIRPFIKDGYVFCNQPAYAARVDITPDGPQIRTIKKAPNFDLSIDKDGNINETPYNRECSELMG